jgi:triosephosphate isomerase (TIM)
MRKKIVAGNWKMNLSKEEAIQLYKEIDAKRKTISLKSTLIVFPPFIYLDCLKSFNLDIEIGVQNFYPEEKGAFTGEVSVSQIKNMGATYTLIGHSERRMYFHENHEFLKLKVEAALKHGLHIVFCCGEPLEIREENTQNKYVKKQLVESLFHLSEENFKKITVAYEPIWAIGTGKTASSSQAEEMHAAIRGFISDKYSKNVAENCSILYGGSCNPTNAAELFACENVDGGLIGGASLKSEDFLKIANSF